jgi:hypothetical protein
MINNAGLRVGIPGSVDPPTKQKFQPRSRSRRETESGIVSPVRGAVRHATSSMEAPRRITWRLPHRSMSLPEIRENAYIPMVCAENTTEMSPRL